ncbi:hypothetical protein ZWY2020_059956 [Hordeum vulgare]|nr:hypothetical protein ZWY2020_059956 [Hordeum vulgare]
MLAGDGVATAPRFGRRRPGVSPLAGGDLCRTLWRGSMERWRRVSVLAMALLLLSACHGAEFSVKNHDQSLIYDHTLAKTIVEYASAVYMTDLTALYTWTCSRCNDLTQDFEMRSLIVDVENCLQAFVGVAHNLNSIIVAIRGTQENSVQNWIKDLIWKQLDLSYPNMPKQSGFFSSYNNTILRLAITSAVHKARKTYGDIGVIVTGHSMGGAMAAFCALDLAVWIDDSDGNTTEQICDASGEDPNCCRCLSILSLSIQDHFTYLGVDMESDDWSTCRIITAQSVERLRKDLASNIIMTKHDAASPLLRIVCRQTGAVPDSILHYC